MRNATQKQLQERFKTSKRDNYRESLRFEGFDTSGRKIKSVKVQNKLKEVRLINLKLMNFLLGLSRPIMKSLNSFLN